jgi:hypothetical protein
MHSIKRARAFYGGASVNLADKIVMRPISALIPPRATQGRILTLR